MNRQSGNPQVKRRRVFYIPGYDPIHPRRYRELYRKESAGQARISGYEVALRPRKPNGNYGWNVDAVIDDEATATEVEVLVWSDIVRDSMGLGIGATYMQMLRTAWAYIGTGALWRLMRLRKGPVIAALYPVIMLIVQAILACVAALGLGHAIGLLIELLINQATGTQVGAFPGRLVFVVSGLAFVWLFLTWFKRWDNKLFVYYLMHDYSYSARSWGENPPELEARISEFTEAIAAALHDDVDEVLVVGHSSGAHLGVSILSDLIRSGRVSTQGPALGFLTLGQVVPMVSFLPRAWRLRNDLAYLSERKELFWVDVTAPGDGCAFALCDPVSVSGCATKAQKWPLVFSAAFTQTLSPERWKELRWKFFRLHFQYLCAFDAPRDYDYFKITAGPQTLAARYAGRQPSKSRKVIPVNKYTSLTP